MHSGMTVEQRIGHLKAMLEAQQEHIRLVMLVCADAAAVELRPALRAEGARLAGLAARALEILFKSAQQLDAAYTDTLAMAGRERTVECDPFDLEGQSSPYTEDVAAVLQTANQAAAILTALEADPSQVVTHVDGLLELSKSLDTAKNALIHPRDAAVTLMQLKNFDACIAGAQAYGQAAEAEAAVYSVMSRVSERLHDAQLEGD